MTQPPPSYQPGPPMGHGAMQPEHPDAQTVQLLGIIGIFVSICAFIAWYKGAQAKKQIDAGAPYLWGGALKTGYLLGKIISIIAIVGMAIAIVFGIIAIIGLAAAGGMS